MLAAASGASAAANSAAANSTSANSAAAHSAAALPSCSWDSPGTNPYRGELVAAVDHYSDIPAATRAALKARMAAQRYDDIAVIGRNHITGQWHYGAELRDMHFGSGTVCRTVTRKRWAPQAEERGLVYCEAGHCLIVPTVCRNVSRVVRRQAVAAAPAAGGTGAGEGPQQGSTARVSFTPALTAGPEGSELQFDPPGAGRALATGSDALPWTGPSALTLVDDRSASAPLLASLAPTEALGLAAPSTTEGPGGNPGPGGGGSTSVPQPLDPWLPSTGGGGLLPIGPGLPTPPTAPVPEPATAALMALGLAVLARQLAGHAARPKSSPQPTTTRA